MTINAVNEPDDEVIVSAPTPPDPMTALAVTMQAKAGAFALLLGSGVSRSALIPTGWDIIKELIRRIALSVNEPDPAEPEAWYQERFGMAPAYGHILEQLAATGAERSQLIRPFIEPNDEERASGLKQPTEAHRAIADLVTRGYIRVIVTTNFDRLLEQALEAVGITPTVIASAEAIDGTLPLTHNRCTIIKVHGDYADARIKNTPAELGTYDDRLNVLLSQVFREYGLIVCGWSGEWDAALRTCLQATRSPWFTTYWSTRRALSGTVQDLVTEREGRVITNMDADQLFRQLADTVASINDSDQSASLSAALARAAVKRYVVDPAQRIRLEDLLTTETRKVLRALSDVPDGWYLPALSVDFIETRLRHYESLTATLRDIVAAGCYWGGPDQNALWTDVIKRLANVARPYSYPFSDEHVVTARLYPALLTFYAAGIASIAKGRYDLLRSLFMDITVQDRETRRSFPLLMIVNPTMLYRFDEILAPDARRAGVAIGRRLTYTPLLWDGMRRDLVSDQDFLDAADRFEYLLGMEMLRLRSRGAWDSWAYAGSYAYRSPLGGMGMAREMGEELDATGINWPPVRAGLFGGDLESVRTLKLAFDARLPR